MIPLSLIGTLQDHHNVYRSEDPLGDVWNRIERLSLTDHLRAVLSRTSGAISPDEKAKYAAVRLRQAVEFRRAAAGTSFLTRPLALYYSFLNIVRAFQCLNGQTAPAERHGLQFNKSDSVLACAAKVTRKGTFAEYLALRDVPAEGTITLAEAIGFIIEMQTDLHDIPGVKRQFTQVGVDVTRGLGLLYRFANHVGDFEADRALAYPPFSNYELIEKCTLRVPGIGPEGTLEAARPIVRSALMQSLHYNELDAPWYIYRKDHSVPQWPRPAYYFAAIFILGSVARYEPELLLGQNGINATDTGWLLSRVLDCAERFFPQIMLSDASGREFYFERH